MIDVSIQFKCQEQLSIELNLHFFLLYRMCTPQTSIQKWLLNSTRGLMNRTKIWDWTTWKLKITRRHDLCNTFRQQKNIKPGPLCHFNSKIIRCSHQWMLQTNKLSWITAMKVYKTLGGMLFFRVIFFFNHSWLKVQVWFAQSTFTIVCYGQCKVIVMFKSCLIMYILYVYHRYMDFVSVSRE